MIPWVAIRLLLSDVSDGLVKGLSSVAKWVFSDWRNGPLVIAALMWAAHALLITPKLRADLADTGQLLAETQLTHLGTIFNFIDASAEAQRQAQANVARVEAQQEAINHEVTRDLRSDLAAVTARFDRLRARYAAAGNPRGADAAGLPQARDAAGGIAGAAAHQDLLTAGDLTSQPACPSQLICLTIAEAEEASAAAHRHDRLIDFVIGQSAVRFTPEESPE